MTHGGFLEQRSARPGSLAIVIALHATVVTALMLSKTQIVTDAVTSLEVRNIPDTPPPPPQPLPKPKPEPQVHQKTVITQVPPEIVFDRPTEIALDRQTDLKPVYDPGPIGNIISEPVQPEPKPEPVPEPVRKEAQMLASSELQPPYPASEQRAGNEGSVTIRVHIGPDGRVKSVEKVRGSSDAFFRATEQQALRHWRFKPATVDGQPVASVKVMTVRFELAA